jgi:hypothetical protein
MSKTKSFKKTRKVTRRIKYFTKPLLQEAAQNAEKWDFNRQLDLDAINAIPDARYPVELNLLHHHRHGEPAEEHMRAMVVLNDKGGFAIVDMPLEFWYRLPEVQLPTPKERAKQRRRIRKRRLLT